jgi:undecaprenyl phosphate N,N'-diacetylbacillosamine 1-phosphate transferase
MYKKNFKRPLDILLSIIILILISPLFILLLVVLTFEFRGNPFFIQKRPGENEKEILVIKFKTMNDLKDKDGNLLPNNIRLTKTGHFLRNYSLDEFPQLINVIKGDLSLVGPRPLLFKYIPLYSEDQRRRHLIKPGMTGWAQVNGRNAISWTKKFELDIYYLNNLSFLLDLKILWKTGLQIIKPHGINAQKNITMPPFDGKN